MKLQIDIVIEGVSFYYKVEADDLGGSFSEVDQHRSQIFKEVKDFLDAIPKIYSD